MADFIQLNFGERGKNPIWCRTREAKAIAHPTDSRLLETARQKLVEAAKESGIGLKQTYAQEGRALAFRASRYAHARQFRRMRKAIKRQRTIVGRLARHIDRQIHPLTAAIRQALAPAPDKAHRLIEQSKRRKNAPGPKLYSWHAPEVSCINKGKARTPYEFGCKVGIASTVKGNLIVGTRSFSQNPFDGHTLNEQFEQAQILMQDTGVKANTVYVDLGYRGVDRDNPSVSIKHRGKYRSLTDKERERLKRRQTIEPIIGHLKADHRMDRCHLKGTEGDAIHAVLCAVGYNIRWLLRMIRKKGGVAFYCRCFRRAVYAGCGQILMWASGISCLRRSITFPKRFGNEFFMDDELPRVHFANSISSDNLAPHIITLRSEQRI